MACEARSFASQPPAAVTLAVDLSLGTWSDDSCPSAPRHGYQTVHFGSSVQNTAFDATQGAIRILRAGSVTGVVRLDATQRERHVLVGVDERPTVRHGCQRMGVCGACIDGFTQVEAHTSIATFRMDVRPGELLRVLLVPSQFDGVATGTLHLNLAASAVDCNLLRRTAADGVDDLCAHEWDGMVLRSLPSPCEVVHASQLLDGQRNALSLVTRGCGLSSASAADSPHIFRRVGPIDDFVVTVRVALPSRVAYSAMGLLLTTEGERAREREWIALRQLRGVYVGLDSSGGDNSDASIRHASAGAAGGGVWLRLTRRAAVLSASYRRSQHDAWRPLGMNGLALSASRALTHGALRVGVSHSVGSTSVVASVRFDSFTLVSGGGATRHRALPPPPLANDFSPDAGVCQAVWMVDRCAGASLAFDGTHDTWPLPPSALCALESAFAPSSLSPSTGGFGVSLWFRTTHAAGQARLLSYRPVGAPASLNIDLVNSSSGGGGGGSFGGDGGGAAVRTHVCTLDGTCAALEVGTVGMAGVGLADGRWHQYALGVSRGGAAAIYLDGSRRSGCSRCLSANSFATWHAPRPKLGEAGGLLGGETDEREQSHGMTWQPRERGQSHGGRFGGQLARVNFMSDHMPQEAAVREEWRRVWSAPQCDQPHAPPSGGADGAAGMWVLSVGFGLCVALCLLGCRMHSAKLLWLQRLVSSRIQDEGDGTAPQAAGRVAESLNDAQRPLLAQTSVHRLPPSEAISYIDVAPTSAIPTVSIAPIEVTAVALEDRRLLPSNTEAYAQSNSPAESQMVGPAIAIAPISTVEMTLPSSTTFESIDHGPPTGPPRPPTSSLDNAHVHRTNGTGGSQSSTTSLEAFFAPEDVADDDAVLESLDAISTLLPISDRSPSRVEQLAPGFATPLDVVVGSHSSLVSLEDTSAHAVLPPSIVDRPTAMPCGSAWTHGGDAALPPSPARYAALPPSPIRHAALPPSPTGQVALPCGNAASPAALPCSQAASASMRTVLPASPTSQVALSCSNAASPASHVALPSEDASPGSQAAVPAQRFASPSPEHLASPSGRLASLFAALPPRASSFPPPAVRGGSVTAPPHALATLAASPQVAFDSPVGEARELPTFDAVAEENVGDDNATSPVRLRMGSAQQAAGRAPPRVSPATAARHSFEVHANAQSVEVRRSAQTADASGGWRGPGWSLSSWAVSSARARGHDNIPRGAVCSVDARRSAVAVEVVRSGAQCEPSPPATMATAPACAAVRVAAAAPALSVEPPSVVVIPLNPAAPRGASA